MQHFPPLNLHTSACMDMIVPFKPFSFPFLPQTTTFAAVFSCVEVLYDAHTRHVTFIQKKRKVFYINFKDIKTFFNDNEWMNEDEGKLWADTSTRSDKNVKEILLYWITIKRPSFMFILNHVKWISEWVCACVVFVYSTWKVLNIHCDLWYIMVRVLLIILNENGC